MWIGQLLSQFLTGDKRLPQPPGDLRYSPAERMQLCALLVAALALRIWAAFAFPSIYHPDEFFQYLEQSHRLAFGYGVVPWEYRLGIRSWLLPGVIAGLMRVTAWFGGGASAYMAVVQVVLAALSLTIVAVAWLFARKISGRTAALIAAVFTAVWFELIYFSAKPLTESVAASALFCAAYFIGCGDIRRRGIAISAGVLLGCALVLRVHLSPAVLLLGLIALYRFPRPNVFYVVGGAAAMVIAGGLLDWATWGTPFQSMWRNFAVNIIEDKASKYGVAPWYYYINLYFKYWTYVAVPLGLLVLIGARRAPYLLAIGAVIVLAHSAIGLKQYRFVFPALPFFILLMALGTAAVIDGITQRWPRLPRTALVMAAVLLWMGCSIGLGARERIRYIWVRSAPAIAAFKAISHIEDMCGLGVIGRGWASLPGYTYLHRNVPLYVFANTVEGRRATTAFNVAFARPEAKLGQAGFQRGACYKDGQFCIYRRPDGCKFYPAMEVNRMLIDRGQ